MLYLGLNDPSTKRKLLLRTLVEWRRCLYRLFTNHESIYQMLLWNQYFIYYIDQFKIAFQNRKHTKHLEYLNSQQKII